MIGPLECLGFQAESFVFHSGRLALAIHQFLATSHNMDKSLPSCLTAARQLMSDSTRGRTSDNSSVLESARKSSTLPEVPDSPPPLLRLPPTLIDRRWLFSLALPVPSEVETEMRPGTSPVPGVNALRRPAANSCPIRRISGSALATKDSVPALGRSNNEVEAEFLGRRVKCKSGEIRR